MPNDIPSRFQAAIDAVQRYQTQIEILGGGVMKDRCDELHRRSLTAPKFGDLHRRADCPKPRGDGLASRVLLPASKPLSKRLRLYFADSRQTYSPTLACPATRRRGRPGPLRSLLRRAARPVTRWEPLRSGRSPTDRFSASCGESLGWATQPRTWARGRYASRTGPGSREHPRGVVRTRVSSAHIVCNFRAIPVQSRRCRETHRLPPQSAARLPTVRRCC